MTITITNRFKTITTIIKTGITMRKKIITIYEDTWIVKGILKPKKIKFLKMRTNNDYNRSGRAFFAGGSRIRSFDPKPILHEVNPTSTARIFAIIDLCDVIERPVVLTEPRNTYTRGRGPQASDAMPIIAGWSITIRDMNNRPITIDFDVTNDNSPITIGIDIQWFCITDNISKPSRLILNHPRDTKPRILHT